MKPRLLTIILLAASTALSAQYNETSSLRLAVVKSTGENPKALLFKPGKRITIKTDYGGVLTTRDYHAVDNKNILFNQMDTIGVDEIISVKGRVKGFNARKLAGASMLAGGTAAGYSVIGLSVWANSGKATPPDISPSFPLFGIAIAGIFVAGPREFNTTKNWNLVIR